MFIMKAHILMDLLVENEPALQEGVEAIANVWVAQPRESEEDPAERTWQRGHGRCWRNIG